MASFFKDFLCGLMGAIVAVCAFLLAVSLGGCASMPDYINASTEERAACAQAGSCTIWTDAELKKFAEGMFKAGFERGVKHERSSL